MRTFLYKLQLLIFCSVLSIACTEDIDIHTNDSKPRVVVFGAFSQDSVRNYVSISKSMGFFSQYPPTPISTATVTITSNNKIYKLQSDTVAGRYYIDSLDMVAGREYVLDIRLDFDDNGQDEYYQARSVMTNTPRIDSVKLSDKAISKFPLMFVYGEIFYTTDNNFCVYNWKGKDTIGIFDYTMIMPEKYLRSFHKVYTVPYFVRKGAIHKGDTLNIRIDNFNNPYSGFVSQAASTGMQNPFFSSPPSEVKTNIRCLDADIRVSGFFTTYSRGAVFSVISNIDFDFGSIGGMR